MKILITRPESDALPLAEKLKALGHDTRLVPLLRIVPRQNVVIPQRPYQAICLTSANGLAVPLDLREHHQTPMYCVGLQSAARAKDTGFSKILSADGDVADLLRLVTQQCRKEDGPILYLSGAETSGDLEGKLLKLGYVVDRIVTYDAVAKTPENLAGDIVRAEAVLLYSPRSAKLWLAACAAADVDPTPLLHICLSNNVARALPSHFRQEIAATPDETAVIATLDRMSKHE